MVENRQHGLFEAVKLLEEIIDGLTVMEVSPGSEGSARLLLIRLQRLKDLLGKFDQHDDPGWSLVALGVLLREAARWMVEMINNKPYIIRPYLSGHEGWNRATWVRAEVLQAESGY